MLGVDRWPTQAQVDSTVAGQLDWPTAGGWEQYGNPDRQYLVDAPPNNLNNFTAYAPGMYLDGNNKLYRVSDHQGLRGTFFIAPTGGGGLVENTDSLMRYQLWEHIGYAADPYSAAADEIFYTEKSVDFANAQASTANEPGIPDTRNMYFWDGVSRDALGEPKLTLYYIDGQGQNTTGAGTVGIDFYEMKSNSSASLHMHHTEIVMAGHPGQQGGRGGGGQLNVDGTQHTEPVPTVPGVEGNEGEASAGTAYQETYATTLAWQPGSSLVRHTASVGTQKRRDLSGGNYMGFVDTEPTSGLYEIFRPKMLEVTASVFNKENRIVSSGSPDQLQSRIQANLRTKLGEEGFAEVWIDFFFATEKVHTITPEGFDLFGTDQAKRPIPAGTDPEQIKNMRMSPGDYTTYPWVAPPSPPASRVVVHAPFGYIVPPLGQSGPQGGPPNTQLDNWSSPQLLQKYPANYSFSGYTLQTLNPRIARDEVFYFDYAPNNISYQGLGAQWVEVPRSGDLPIVEFASWALMKVSMDFLIANTRMSSKGHQHPDGLVTGIYEKIEILRRMAQRPYPISVFGLDQLLRVSMRRAEMIGKPLEFVISDLNISSMRRTIEAGNKEITTAQVKLTLQEMPVEVIKSVRFGTPGIVVPMIPSDPDGAASSAEVGLHVTADRNIDQEVATVKARDPMNTLNPGTGSNTSIGVSSSNRHAAHSQWRREKDAIDYEGYDEWASDQ